MMIGALRTAGHSQPRPVRSTPQARRGTIPFLPLLFSFEKSSRHSRSSSPGRPRSGWPMLSAQDTFLPIKASLPTTLTPSSTQSHLFSFVFHPPQFFSWPRLFARLSRRLEWARGRFIHHSTKPQQQLLATKRRLTTSRPLEYCPVRDIAAVSSPFDLRLENVRQVNWFPNI
jgi:hypothetical protein